MKEEFQRKILNDYLRQINELKRKKHNKKDDNIVEMIDKYNKNNEYFYLEIHLLEMLPKNKSMIYNNNIFPNTSPQEIAIGFLEGNIISTKYKQLLFYKMGRDLIFKMITPNLNKNIWYIEKNLVIKGVITTYCIMNLTDMTNILKYSPIPKLCLSPGLYKISDPKDFIKIINELDDEIKKCFDFIPFLRNYSKINTIKPEAVYYLHGNIEIVDKDCFYDNKDILINNTNNFYERN